MIHIAMHQLAGGKPVWDSVGGSDEDGFVLHFSLVGHYPPSRLHEAFSDHLNASSIPWIVSKRRHCEVDLDGARTSLDAFLSAPWITGRVEIEPDIDDKERRGFYELGPHTRIALRIVRRETELQHQSRIFLSHKGANKPLVRRFYDALKELKFDPWLDEEDIVHGSTLHRALDEGMSGSCAAVFFITPQFVDEKYLKHEIDLAMRERTAREPRFNIITLSLSDEKGVRGAVPQVLRTFVFGEPNSELEALRQILRALPLRVGAIEWR